MINQNNIDSKEEKVSANYAFMENYAQNLGDFNPRLDKEYVENFLANYRKFHNDYSSYNTSNSTTLADTSGIKEYDNLVGSIENNYNELVAYMAGLHIPEGKTIHSVGLWSRAAEIASKIKYMEEQVKEVALAIDLYPQTIDIPEANEMYEGAVVNDLDISDEYLNYLFDVSETNDSLQDYNDFLNDVELSDISDNLKDATEEATLLGENLEESVLNVIEGVEVAQTARHEAEKTFLNATKDLTNHSFQSISASAANLAKEQYAQVSGYTKKTIKEADRIFDEIDNALVETGNYIGKLIQKQLDDLTSGKTGERVQDAILDAAIAVRNKRDDFLGAQRTKLIEFSKKDPYDEVLVETLDSLAKKVYEIDINLNLKTSEFLVNSYTNAAKKDHEFCDKVAARIKTFQSVDAKIHDKKEAMQQLITTLNDEITTPYVPKPYEPSEDFKDAAKSLSGSASYLKGALTNDFENFKGRFKKEVIDNNINRLKLIKVKSDARDYNIDTFLVEKTIRLLNYGLTNLKDLARETEKYHEEMARNFNIQAQRQSFLANDSYNRIFKENAPMFEDNTHFGVEDHTLD